MVTNTWILPKNKRTLAHIPYALAGYMEVTEGISWSKNKEVQREFEKMLEKDGLKGGGRQYDPDGGGARTYKAQLSALGLIFEQEIDNETLSRPTLAGQAILNGENHVQILRHQLLKFQYPSPYSKSKGVGLSEAFKIRPFLFTLKLLLDQNIKYLDSTEIAFFIIPYAKKMSDFNRIKQKILEYRQEPELFELPNTFMEDTNSSRTKSHSLQKRLDHLKDIANIFINHLFSCRLIIRPEKQKIEIDPDATKIVSDFLINEPSLIDDPNEEMRFQRIFGLDPNHIKDTRQFNVKPRISEESIIKRNILSEYYSLTSNEIFVEVNPELIDKICNKTGYLKEKIVKILDTIQTTPILYFEETYITIAHQGNQNSNAFEKATLEIFNKEFAYKTKHVGQITPKTRPGGNPDIIIISESDRYCGILDSKAYDSYALCNDHRNRMLENYIPNVKEHSENFDLSFFVYISGGFSNTFEKTLNKLVESTEKFNGKIINGSGISARNLIYLCQKAREENISHIDLKRLFSCNSIITSEQINSIFKSEPALTEA